MELLKTLMSHNPTIVTIDLTEHNVNKGDVIETVVAQEYDPHNLKQPFFVKLKHTVNNDKKIKIDLSGVLKNFPTPNFDLQNIHTNPSVKIPIIQIDSVDSLGGGVSNKLFYLMYGTAEFSGTQSIINNRLAPQSKEPNLTFFKGYPQIDTYVLNTDLGLAYKHCERDYDYVVWQDIVKRPSDNIQRVVDECGIFIRWRNNWGGWSYWLFDDKYTEEIKTKSLGHFTRPYVDYESRTQRLFDFGLTATKQWTLTSKVPVLQNELNEIKTLFTSSEIYLFKGKKTIKSKPVFELGAECWERVTISAGSHKFQENEHATSSFSVTIEFQEIPTIKNI